MAKRYIEHNLNKNEHVVLEAKISWLTLIPSAIWLIIMIVVYVKMADIFKALDLNGKDEKEMMGYVGLIALVLGIIPLLFRLLINATTNLAVTNKRVIGKVGVLKVHTIDFHIDKVDNVSYRAGFFGNLFRYYTVEVKGGGSEKKGPTVGGISNAANFKNMVTEAIELHAEEGRKEQARLIGEAMVAALEQSALQFTATPKAPKAAPKADPKA